MPRKVQEPHNMPVRSRVTGKLYRVLRFLNLTTGAKISALVNQALEEKYGSDDLAAQADSFFAQFHELIDTYKDTEP